MLTVPVTAAAAALALPLMSTQCQCIMASTATSACDQVRWPSVLSQQHALESFGRRHSRVTLPCWKKRVQNIIGHLLPPGTDAHRCSGFPFPLATGSGGLQPSFGTCPQFIPEGASLSPARAQTPRGVVDMPPSLYAQSTTESWEGLRFC
jgi:hypothetical protein